MNLALAPAADRRLMPEGRLAGPMPWVIAIMAFLTALATAAGIGLADGAASLKSALDGRLSVQIVEANSDARDRGALAVQRELAKLPEVAEVTVVSDAEMRDLLAPWLGQTDLDGDLPVPTLIDVSLNASKPGAFDAVTRAVHAIVPTARVDRQDTWLRPLSELMRTLMSLAAAVIGMMVAAMVAAVILSSRAALVTHHETISVMHLMGANDDQVARLFQRRAALDTIFGSALGVAVASVVIVALGQKLGDVGAAIADQGGLGLQGWIILALLPLAATAIALVTARLTVLRALGRML